MKTLAQILAEKKAASASSASSIPEDFSEPFPLALLLQLYCLADKHDVYADYMAGFKALVKGLGPIAIPPGPYPPLIPSLYNYQQQEIAVILRCRPEAVQAELIKLFGFIQSS